MFHLEHLVWVVLIVLVVVVLESVRMFSALAHLNQIRILDVVPRFQIDNSHQYNFAILVSVSPFLTTYNLGVDIV